MLNNKRAFANLMALLSKIDPNIPLPDALGDYLFENMVSEAFCFKARTLETEGAIPKNAYYVVCGFVIVYGFDEKLDRFVFRIYRENSIVALNCFMKQVKSDFTIIACRNTLVLSISSSHMHQIYKNMPGMEQMALKTALEYGAMKEQSRASLLVLDIEERIFEFYQRYKGLLPAKRSPIKDTCIACFLNTSIDVLRKKRHHLKIRDLLKY